MKNQFGCQVSVVLLTFLEKAGNKSASLPLKKLNYSLLNIQKCAYGPRVAAFHLHFSLFKRRGEKKKTTFLGLWRQPVL